MFKYSERTVINGQIGHLKKGLELEESETLKKENDWLLLEMFRLAANVGLRAEIPRELRWSDRSACSDSLICFIADIGGGGRLGAGSLNNQVFSKFG